MTDIFKAAIGILGRTGYQENDFVGQYVELGDQKLRIRKVIAEGGFAFVFIAQDLADGKEYALKRLLANDEESNKVIVQEVCYLKKLSGHPNIVQFVSAASIGKEESGHGQSEYLILTELCSGGQLVDLFKAKTARLRCDEAIHIFYQVCRAVQHMHKQKPALIHRDLKIENLLLSTRGHIKLCDFGSATTKTHEPDHSWSSIKRSMVEDEIARNTTPMYRAPEMLDLYQNYPINEASDMWALGCILYYLCFDEHPFEDSAKLRIINANYNIPASDTEYIVLHDLIRRLLSVDPRDRPNIHDVVGRLQEVAEARNVNLKGPVTIGGIPLAQPSPEQRSVYQTQVIEDPALQGQQSSLFSSLRGGAGSLMKNLKDASNKMMETVSASMNKGDLDINYITSRVVVMSFPAEGIETAYRNHIDDVRYYLESRHSSAYAVYNLSQRQYRNIKFQNRVSECGWSSRKAPTLHNLLAICRNMHLWLRQNQKNVCVVHCLDGKAVSGTVVAAFLNYCRLFDSPSSAIELFTAKRIHPQLCPSQIRYIQYICDMTLGDLPTLPHNKPVMLSSISMTPVPLMKRMRTGCKPFVEIFVGEDRILSTSQEYEKMADFNVEDGKATIPLNISIAGDVTIAIYHARSTFGGKVQGKISSVKICQFQFHTGFIKEESRKLAFSLSDLDQLDTSDKYSSDFIVTLDMVVNQKERPRAKDQVYAWDNFTPKGLSPKILFVDKEEMIRIVSDFGASDRAKRKQFSRSSSENSNDSGRPSPTRTHAPINTTPSPAHPPAHPPARPPPPVKSVQNGAGRDSPVQNRQNGVSPAPKATFFSTLDWQADDHSDGNSTSRRTRVDSADDEFEALTNARLSTPTQNPPDLIGSSGQPTFGQEQPDFFTDPSQADQPVDLLNIGGESVDDTAAKIDLMNIGQASNNIGQASNLDLLSTNTTASDNLLGDLDFSSQETTTKPTKKDTDDFAFFDNRSHNNNKQAQNNLFDPFHGSSSSVSQSKPDVTRSAAQSNTDFDSFDPFNSGGNVMSSKKAEPDLLGFGRLSAPDNEGLSHSQSGPDLMSGWGSGLGGGPVPMSSQRSTTPQPKPTAKADPFADFGNLAGFGSAGSSPKTTPRNTPVHLIKQNMTQQQQPASQQHKPAFQTGTNIDLN